jgi:predicted DNA-binding transcriptional regulator AlpA
VKTQVAQFEDLPDNARISADTFAVLMDAHVNTIWRRVKDDPSFPKPIKLSKRCTRFRAGDVRAYLDGVAV